MLFRYIFVASLGAIVLIVICCTYLLNSTTPRATGGFDFTLIESEPWSGPLVGEKIDITKLTDLEEKPLSSQNIQRPIMLCLINTGCGMCTLAKDHMEYIKDTCSKNEISYVLINVSAKNRIKAHRFMQGLGVNAPTYVWLNDESTFQKLYLMVSPSHLLVSSDGVILAKWPGSSDIQERRDRMGNQAIADMIALLLTLR